MGLVGADCQWLRLGEAGRVCWEWGRCRVGSLPGLRDDNIEERFVGFAKAGEADFEDHCLSTSLLGRKSLECPWEGKILVGLRLHPRFFRTSVI